ncbi:MAG: hypothetical protein COT67_00720 [Candidatus Tagabacteria bacterium CG09_land_8_20_14_0_10_41_14]|uniref:Lon proteolytic domain-containing protein n=1 Tax=Candidatus Tagabacteria bacterium CG09_land_8_20_14_0_10_41_14 TaxID=1975021 RepID=A0A2H0WLS9_9BACT|nr:MAG: hypothetical protein COT67_00720 [Candidatus Tagabacteria bacterium CG09_land_8_20_14_0_10_41_14]
MEEVPFGVAWGVAVSEHGGGKEFIMPRKNKNDLAEVPESVKKNLKIHLVETVDEVLDIVFPSRRRKH